MKFMRCSTTFVFTKFMNVFHYTCLHKSLYTCLHVMKFMKCSTTLVFTKFMRCSATLTLSTLILTLHTHTAASLPPWWPQCNESEPWPGQGQFWCSQSCAELQWWTGSSCNSAHVTLVQIKRCRLLPKLLLHNFHFHRNNNKKNKKMTRIFFPFHFSLFTLVMLDWFWDYNNNNK